MTQKFYLLSKSLLTKIALVAALMSWGGIAAEADDIVIYDEGSSMPTGWTVSNASNMYIDNNSIVCNNSAPYLQSTETWSFSNKRFVVVAKRTNDTDSYIKIGEGWTAKCTIGYGSNTSSYELSDDFIELYFDLYSATNISNLRITGKNVIIKSIKLCENIPLLVDENKLTAISKGAKSEPVLFKYSVRQGWNTICVPFNLKATYGTAFDLMTNIFGTEYQAYALNSYTSGTLAFSKSMTTISKNTPILVYSPNAVLQPDGIELSSNVDITFAKTYSQTKNGITFQGTYAPMPAGSLVGKYGVTSDGKLAKGSSGAWMKGYRAYLTGLPTGAQARIIVIDGDDETTDIGGLAQIVDDEILGKGGSKAPRAYNLQGQQVRNGKKGIYVVNGKKIVVK